MNVIVRDDDVSYFTPPGFLERLYEPLWERGLPVCLSVIPQHYDSVFVAYRTPSAAPDENTPPFAFGLGRTHAIGDNRALTSRLDDLSRAGCAELCLHGFEHRYREFDVDEVTARNRLRLAVSAFGASFPTVAPETFVPPYEGLSSQALAALAEHSLNIATCLDTLREVGLFDGQMSTEDDGVVSLSNGRTAFGCARYLFDPLASDAAVETAMSMVLSRRPRLLILANHYWDFFDRFSTPRRERLRLWKEFVDELIARGARFTTFAREARQLRASL
jgi:Uncharacterized protein conserved in bacteria (DUF2334)